MRSLHKWPTSLAAGLLFRMLAFAARAQNEPSQIGREVAVPRHLQNADSGEALRSRQAFESFRPYDRDCLIEFLKTLQVLPPGMANSFIDERGRPRRSD